MSVRNIIEIDEEKCDGCGNCVIACAEGAIEIHDGKARIVKESYCDGLGACLGECPQGALTVVVREAEPFDEEAVKEHLERLKGKSGREPTAEAKAACPSVSAMSFAVPDSSALARIGKGESNSLLRNWPVQIELLPINAPFFQDAHLLIAADCFAFAAADFHEQYLDGKVLAVGCPKLDDTSLYLEKLTNILAENTIQAVTIAYMEVPCCSGLVHLVKKALTASGRAVPLTTIKLGVQGNVLEREELPAGEMAAEG
ncbi:MAG: 4Fe-4S binding protein [Deltaproteobacteria bacterium]|nr:4Fe-4S binding protein [Deltaproteobacteria bacterium]MBW2071151.1 4Fe-4S binding protein [Deltaproteobacteria bacterium]